MSKFKAWAIEPNNRIVRLDPKGRTHQVLQTFTKYHRATTDTWGALFKTKKHKRRERTVTKIARHFDWVLKQRVPDMTAYCIINAKDGKTYIEYSTDNGGK